MSALSRVSMLDLVNFSPPLCHLPGESWGCRTWSFLWSPPVLLSSRLFPTLETWLALPPPAGRAAGCSPGEQHGLVAAEGDCSLAETLGIRDSPQCPSHPELTQAGSGENGKEAATGSSSSAHVLERVSPVTGHSSSPVPGSWLK